MKDADGFADELFPHRRSGTVDYARWNAFHHAMWMAMMVSRGVSPKDALLLGAAHELDSFAPGRRRPFGPVSQIDLHNSAAGVQIGLTSRGSSGRRGCQTHRGRGSAAVHVRIRRLLRSGLLR
jgi:hypothetical protein